MKQKSKRQKGLEFQRWIKAWLEEKGWLIHNQTPAGRMIVIKGKKIFISQRNDIWGTDLLCRKKYRMLWIQATLDSKVTKRVEAYLSYFKSLFDGEELQIWIKTPKGEINIKQCFWNQGAFLTRDIGKIIRRKFYCSEGINYEF